MSPRIDGLPSDDQQPTDLIPRVVADETATMPALEMDLAPVKPSRHRRPRRFSARTVVTAVATVAGLAMAAGAVLVVASRDGGAVREPVTSPTAPVSSVPHLAVSVPPLTAHPSYRPPVRRRFVPAVPAPTHKRPSVTPKPSVSASPKPSHTATPKASPTLTPPTATPGVSGAVDHTTRKETPCTT